MSGLAEPSRPTHAHIVALSPGHAGYKLKSPSLEFINLNLAAPSSQSGIAATNPQIKTWTVPG